MSSADTTDHSPAAIAAQLADAPFVRFVGTPDGDALAAIGVLARTIDRPFQARLDRLASVRDGADDLTVSVGTDGGTVALTERPLATQALEIGAELAVDPIDTSTTTLALAGVSASERSLDPMLDTVAGPFERRPGVAIPTDSPVDGLAHSTLVHAPFSGCPDSVEALVDQLDDSGSSTRTTIASFVSVSVLDEPNTRASQAIERLVNPVGTPAGPFATIAGYGDVLDGLARSAPGTGLALALGRTSPEEALSQWRSFAKTVHTAVNESEIERHPGCVIASVRSVPPAILEPVGRLIREFRSPEPAVLVVGDEHVVATGHTATAAVPALEQAVDSNAEHTPLTATNGYARVGVRESAPVVDAFTEAI